MLEYNTSMTHSPSLLAWQNTYTRILLENGTTSPSMQCMAFAIACQAHTLTLDEFVTQRKALQVPAGEVFAPSIMATLSDWDGSWEVLNRLLHKEDSHLERIIVHYAKTHQPLPQDVYIMFKNVVEAWAHSHHRISWYQALTPEQSENTMLEVLDGSAYQVMKAMTAERREAVEHALYNVKSNATPGFWGKIVQRWAEHFAPSKKESQRMSQYILQHASSNVQQHFVAAVQLRWEKGYISWNADNFAQWVLDVVQYQPSCASIVLDSVMKKDATVLQSPVISSNTVIIDYFLNQGVKNVSDNKDVRTVLNAMVNGKGNDALRERAWIKKLDLFGAKPSDLKKMETWTSNMTHAFDYWLAASFQKYSHQAPGNVYTHINRETGWEYERRFGIDLRNPESFQTWRDARQAASANPFAAFLANAALCDTWEQGCALYVLTAACPPIELAELNTELFANNMDTAHTLPA